MALNASYVIASDLQGVFVDKDTGQPLSHGIVTFYKDNDREVLKPIYKLTGSPPDYTYTEVANPMTLTASGTFADANGNDIVPYYKPYNENGGVELYFVTVYSSVDGEVPANLQFTREAWPNIVGRSEDNDAVDNYAINGQFLFNCGTQSSINEFNYIAQGPSEGLYASGGQVKGYTDITLTKTNNIATEQISFPSFPPGDQIVEGNAAFYMKYKCTAAGNSETFKWINFPIKGVRSLQNTQVTISLEARSPSSSSISFNISQIFGTGGSPSTTVDTLVATYPLTANFTKYTATTTVPSILGKIIGNNQDDVVLFQIGFPLNQTFEIDLINFCVQIGPVSTPYPYLSLDQVAAQIMKPRTGDIEQYFGSRATGMNFPLNGWVDLKGGTIGNGSSEATLLADARAYPLFCFIWDNMNDANAPVTPGGRGDSANADFTANKKIALPDMKTYTLAGYNSIYLMGEQFGAMTHTMSISEMPAHRHAGSKVPVYQGTGNSNQPTTSNNTTGPDLADINIVEEGGGQAFNITQPTVFCNFRIKL